MRLLIANVIKGTPTAEVLSSLVSQNEAVSAVYSFSYQHPTLLQQRLQLSADEQAIISKAIVLRKESRLPFWEALMLSCFSERRDFTRLIREAGFHQSHKNSMVRIPRDQVLAGRLQELARLPLDEHNLSFSSRIECRGSEFMQLPLLDFHCPETSENDTLVQQVCKELFQNAALVFSSGESYHALGLHSMDDPTFQKFLARSLLFAPIVDARYVAHQLIEGACALRLSASPVKPNQPKLKFALGAAVIS